MDQPKPRLASSTDLQGVLALTERKISPCNEAFYQRVREDDTWQSEYDLYVCDGTQGPTGFLVLKKRLTRGITGDRESVICDLFARHLPEQRSLLECAADAARGYASQFLTIEITPEDSHQREMLEGLGYRLESHRISVATADCRPPEGSPYSVRLAEAQDHFSIAVLNSMMLEHTLCAERDYDLSELTFRSMEAIFHQLGRQDAECAALVLTRGQELVGHLLLELMGQTGYIYDLAVAREHWGGTAVRHIMRAGSQLLFQRGVPLLAGDVSACNLRALKFARHALGFSVDSQRFGRRLH
ncbi:MAG: hypothetical protein AMXMBFR33_44930 [Candidatus Xenobia bacterium]